MSNFLQSGKIMDENGNLLTVKRAFASVAQSQTDSAIIAAVAGKKLRILWFFLLAGGTATSVTFNTKSGGAGTAISPPIPAGVNGGAVSGFNPFGPMETVAGEGLSVTTGAGATTAIMVNYIEVS